MEQEILTPLQKRVLELVKLEPNLSDFYLSGGTALAAYYLHHRFSDDLDFFTAKKVDGRFLEDFIRRLKEALNAQEVRFERLYDRHQYFFIFPDQELKVEFTEYPFVQFETPTEYDGIRVDSLRDVATNKLMAFLDRFDPKDFADLYFLLQNASLEALREDVETKFGIKIGAIFLGGELARVKRIAALPRMIKPLSVDELKSFFSELASSIKGEVLEG